VALFSKKLPEELERKRNSEKTLKREGVPYIKHLPPIEREMLTTRRSKEVVAKRAMALCVVAEKGAKVPSVAIAKAIKHLQISNGFTDKERAFIDNNKPKPAELNNYFWRYESLAVLLWALGFENNLTRPEKECNYHDLIKPMATQSREKFMAAAKLRPQNEILDAADLIYRYHWAVKKGASKKGKYAELDKSVVYERHYALNWLIGYSGLGWDEVTTDT